MTPYAAGAWAYGGIPRVVTTLSRALARQGHRVTIATTDVSSPRARLPRFGREPLPGAWPPQEGSDGVTTLVFPNLSNALAYHAQFFTPIGLGRFLAAHAGDFDVAHLHACRNLPGALAAHHLARAGVPYVLAPNGTAPRIERRLAAKRAFDALAGNRVMAGAACVLAVSRAEVGQLRALGVPSARIRLIANPVETSEPRRRKDRGAFRRRLSVGSNPVVMFLGKLTPRKRVDVLVDAVARLGRPEVRLVIAGNDMGAGASVRAAVRRHGLDDRTIFTGLLEGQDRLDALADADVVVYPSEHEIFGLVPLEALLEGTPVIVSDDSGCGEVIGATGGGLVTPVGDAAALESAVAGILDDTPTWRARAEAAGDRVIRDFGPERIAGEVAGLYEQLRAGAARPAGAAASRLTGVSFVVPVRNGAPWIRRVVGAIEAQADGRPFEIIAVDDGSADASSTVLGELAAVGHVRLIPGPRRGVAAAINVGVRAARYPLIAQVDQDVELDAGWLERMAAAFDDPAVGAVQGRYRTSPTAGMFGRVMGLDLEQRYGAIRGGSTDHVCTGNTIYRRSALERIGLFDESLGYGADNDVSYRLTSAGYRLVFCRAARSLHHWRDSLAGYCRQQYGFGYGRLDVVIRHPSRVAGDVVSPVGMMLHPAVAGVALALGATAGLAAWLGMPWRPTALWSAGLLGQSSPASVEWPAPARRIDSGMRPASPSRLCTCFAMPSGSGPACAGRGAAWQAGGRTLRTACVRDGRSTDRRRSR